MKPEPGLKSAPLSQRAVATSGNLPTRGFTLHTPLRRFICFVVLLTAAFVKPLLGLVFHAANSELHSYILLIPFVSAYLFHIRRNQLPSEYRSSPVWGGLLLIPTSAALISALVIPTLSQNDYLTLVTLSFVCFLLAGGFLFLGKQWINAAVFPLFFLFFLVPMPDAMADALETASKLASTEAASLFFNVTGTPVLRDGTIFQLPNITIRVAQECSGIRSSWVLVITSLVAARLFLETPWRRVLLVCFVIPLGIIRNGFRIWVIGTLCIYFGPQMIRSVIHRHVGPFFFALSLIPLFLLLWWLRRGEMKQQRSARHGGISDILSPKAGNRSMDDRTMAEDVVDIGRQQSSAEGPKI